MAQNKPYLALVTTYSNDDTSGSFVYYCFMICSTKVLNPSALSSLSYVIPVILTFTQRDEAIFEKKRKIFLSYQLSDTGKTKARIAKSIVLMPSWRSQLKRRTFRGGWECIEDCQNPIRACVFIPSSCQRQQ